MSTRLGRSKAESARRYNLAQALRDPYQAIVSRLHERLDRLGFSDVRPAHGTVLQHLPLDGGRLTEIAARSQLTKQTVGYLVDDLEALGYVERAADPRDARARLITYTPKGRESRRQAGEAIKAIEEEWASLLGKRKMAQLRKLLDELRAVIEDEDKRRGAA